MEKEMLALVKFKEGDDKFPKFIGWMQSDEGLAERSKFAIPSKTIGTVTPDKSAVMFKVFVTDKDGMVDFISGKNPAGFLPDTKSIMPSLSCLLYKSPSPRDLSTSRTPSSA